MKKTILVSLMALGFVATSLVSCNKKEDCESGTCSKCAAHKKDKKTDEKAASATENTASEESATQE